MTATEFRVVDAGDPDRARLVADTSKVDQIVPELEKIQQTGGPMGPGGPGGRGTDSGSGLLGSVKEALGMGGSGSGSGLGGGASNDTEDVVRRADRLTGEYADLLQDRLENEGKWERVRSLAAGDPGSTTGADGENDAADIDPDGE